MLCEGCGGGLEGVAAVPATARAMLMKPRDSDYKAVDSTTAEGLAAPGRCRRTMVGVLAAVVLVALVGGTTAWSRGLLAPGREPSITKTKTGRRKHNHKEASDEGDRALLLECHGKPGCVTDTDKAAAGPEAPFGWKTFRVVRRVDGLVSFRTWLGTYLRLLGGAVTLGEETRSKAWGSPGDSADTDDETGFQVVRYSDGTISLKGSGGAFLSAAGGGALVLSKEAGKKEKFHEISHKDGTASLRCFDGSLVDASRADKRTKRLTVLERDQRHELRLIANESDGTVSLRSFYGTYLSVEADGTVDAWSALVDANESFKLEVVVPPGNNTNNSNTNISTVRLRGPNGKYLSVNGEGYAIARSNGSDDNCTLFHMETTQAGDETNVSLRTCRGAYLTVALTNIYTFYMYRAMGDTNYPMTNVNMANLGGVMWYLHNEVVKDAPRKFGITRVVRFRVSTTAPDRLAARGMDFGVRFAYDSQMCTGAGPWNGEGSCDPYYQKYGNFVGCNILGKYPFPMASQGFPVHYGGAKWFSLPKEGACDCEGCVPTGAANCIYSTEWAGDVSVSDLEGAPQWGGYVKYEESSDKGVGNNFWDEKFNDYKCYQRMEAAGAVFHRNHPELPADLPEPDCDFDCTAFYRGITDGPPEDCNETIQDWKASWMHPVSAPGWIWPFDGGDR